MGLAASFFFVMTGETVFQGKSASEIAIAHVTKDPRKPRDINGHLSKNIELIILACFGQRTRTTLC